MADIILLQTRFGFYDAMGARAPNSLLSIAAVPHNQGYDVAVIDQRTDTKWREKLQKHISDGAKVVCLTIIVGDPLRFMMEASRYVKSLNPDVIVALGGSWAQIEPEMCFEDPNVDVVCTGEGDYFLTDIMEYCDGKKKIEDIQGIAYRTKKGQIKKTPPRPLIKNLDELPKIPYHLVDLKEYKGIGLRPGKRALSLLVSRGCGHRCGFCGIPTLYGKAWRSYSVSRVLEDLARLEEEYGITDFFFMDDNLIGNYQWFSEFVEALAKSGRDYCWSAAGVRAPSILRFTEKDLDNIVKSGCRTLDIGVESGNPRILKLIKKDITLDIVRKANQRLKDYPILIKYTFMGGFPTETKAELHDTFKFRTILLDENPNAVGPLFVYTPFPKTPLYEIAMSEGFKVPKTLLEWGDFNIYNWYKKFPSWLTKKRIRLIENAGFLSYFSSKQLGYKYPNPLMGVVFKLYHPVAKFRSDHNYYGFMVEKWAAEMVMALNEKFDIFNRVQIRQAKKNKKQKH